MSLLYIDEPGTKLGVREHRFRVEYRDDAIREIPMESVDSITILGNTQLTTQCMQECMKRGIAVSFFSKGGRYFGRLQSTGHVNTERQRLQCRLYDSPFSLNLAKIITRGKIHNQKIVLRRYAKSRELDVEKMVIAMERCSDKIKDAVSITDIMGFEGYAAKTYFQGISSVIDKQFSFTGRNRQPPRDEFNSLLSLGYSVIMNVMYSSIESKGLNPYFGFLHQDKEKHPTLASDLIEEWRAVLVDSTALSLINGHEIMKDHFYFDEESGACLLTKEGIRIFLSKLENKLQVKTKYLPQTTFPVSFRQGIILQIDLLIHAMQEGDSDIYKPVEIR